MNDDIEYAPSDVLDREAAKVVEGTSMRNSTAFANRWVVLKHVALSLRARPPSK